MKAAGVGVLALGLAMAIFSQRFTSMSQQRARWILTLEGQCLTSKAILAVGGLLLFAGFLGGAVAALKDARWSPADVFAGLLGLGLIVFRNTIIRESIVQARSILTPETQRCIRAAIHAWGAILIMVGVLLTAGVLSANRQP